MSDVKIISPPKGEVAWVSYNVDGVVKYMLTSKENVRDFYFLYEVVDGVLKKLGKARTPLELESKFNIHEILATKG